MRNARAATTRFPVTDVRRVRFANGLTVLVAADRSAPVVAIVTRVKAGYFDETDDIVGIAHVLEHMFFKGTPTRGVGEIARQTKASGGYLNAHTIYDNTSYYTVLPATGFQSGIEIQADAYANSLVDADELRKELEVIIQEAKRKADNPPALAIETLYELLHDRHRMRRWRIGHEAGLRQLTRDKLLSFYRGFYKPSNTILSVVGEVDPDLALERIEALYGSLPRETVEKVPGPEEPDTRGFRYRELSGDVEQTQLLMGWRTPHALHDDTVALDFAADVLSSGRSSRLYRAVRDRGLVSEISAFNYTPTELGVFVLHAECAPEKATRAAPAIWSEMQRLACDAPADAEMQRVRSLFEARWVRALETMEGKANYLAGWEALGDWRLGDRYYERYLGVQPHDVSDVARAYLSPDRAAAVAYRPDNAPDIADSAHAAYALLSRGRTEPLQVEPPVTTPFVRRTRAQFETQVANVRVYRSEAGVPILVRVKHGAPLVHIAVRSIGGVLEETAEVAGVTTLAVKTAARGTARRTAVQIAHEAELLGGSITGSAGVESFGWSFSVPARNLSGAAELLSDVVLTPSFPPDYLDAERSVVLSQLAAMRDDMFHYPVHLAARAAFGDHAYARIAAGTPDSVGSLAEAHVRAWHEERLLRSDCVIGCVGAVDPDEAAALLAGSFEGLRPGATTTLEAPSWPGAATLEMELREKAQTALAVAFPSVARTDERRYAARLVATIASGLGGRFFDELRDRQSLAYTVHAMALEHALAGSFVAYVATSPEREDTAREALLRELERLRTAPVTAAELQRAKRYTTGARAIGQESGGAVLAELLGAWFWGSLEDLDTHDQRVDAVSEDDILELARACFDPSRRAEGLVRGTGRIV